MKRDKHGKPAPTGTCDVHKDVEIPLGAICPKCHADIHEENEKLRHALRKEHREEDEDLPFEDSIHKAHPLETGDFETYDEALAMVCAKHSKYGLVDLVNYLIRQRKEAERGAYALIAELTFRHPDKKPASHWRKWMKDGLDGTKIQPTTQETE